MDLLGFLMRWWFEAVSCGINKVNYDTELKLANIKALKKYLSENPEVYDTRKMFKPCMQAMKDVVKEKIIACNSNNRAW